MVDLGSGGGLDVLLAAQKVGQEGKAIGVDMTKVNQWFSVMKTRKLTISGYARAGPQEHEKCWSI